MADKTVPKQLTPFRKGQSGNPKGRPKGARNRATLAAEVLLDGEAQALTRKAIELALSGDSTALRLCLERILPARRDRPVTFAMPALHGPEDAVRACAALCAAFSSGDLTPTEASELSKLVGAFTTAIELHEIQKRLDRLETAQGGNTCPA